MLERLQKIMAAAGVASRRKSEELITSGLVTVNGQIISELGAKADPEHDHIRVNGKLLHGAERKVYLVLNKPKGYVSTVTDPEGRPTIMDLVRGVGERLYPVGRLDYLSEGLLLLTNDGELMQRLTRAASHVAKTYLVKVSGKPAEEALERLRHGIMLPPETRPGESKPKPEKAVKTAPAQITLFRDAENPWYEVVLTEGRNRQIRRMFKQVGHNVEKIKRVRFGSLELDVEPGQYRRLTEGEVALLTRPPKPRPSRPERSHAGGALPRRPQQRRDSAPRFSEREAKNVGRSYRTSEGGDRRPARVYRKADGVEYRPAGGYQREDRGERKPARDYTSTGHSEERPARGYRPAARGEDRPDRGYGGAGRGEQRPARGYQSADRGERKPGRDYTSKGRSEERPARGYRPAARGEDRPDRGYRGGGRGEQRPTREYPNADRGERKPGRDSINSGSPKASPIRGFQKFEIEPATPAPGYSNSDRGERKPSRGFSYTNPREARPVRGNRESERPEQRGTRDYRDAGRNKPSREFQREDRPARSAGRPDRSEGRPPRDSRSSGRSGDKASRGFNGPRNGERKFDRGGKRPFSGRGKSGRNPRHP